MATDWSEEAKARRSASARKAAETRKANQAKKYVASLERIADTPIRRAAYPYIQNSRVARWALSGVSYIAMLRMNRRMRRRPDDKNGFALG